MRKVEEISKNIYDIYKFCDGIDVGENAEKTLKFIDRIVDAEVATNHREGDAVMFELLDSDLYLNYVDQRQFMTPLMGEVFEPDIDGAKVVYILRELRSSVEEIENMVGK